MKQLGILQNRTSNHVLKQKQPSDSSINISLIEKDNSDFLAAKSTPVQTKTIYGNQSTEQKHRQEPELTDSSNSNAQTVPQNKQLVTQSTFQQKTQKQMQSAN